MGDSNKFSSLGNKRKKLKLIKNMDNKGMGMPLVSECSICLERIDYLSHPDICNHYFCEKYIKAWSETNNTFPICVNEYRNIITYHGKSQKKIL